MSRWQCSHCFRIYAFDDWMKLGWEWVNQKEKHKYGKRAICSNCGKAFHKDKWQMVTMIEGYKVSTVHLELEHGSNTDWTQHGGMWYETMIFTEAELKYARKPYSKDRKVPHDTLSFQARYENKTDAIHGHHLAVKNIKKIILHPEKYPTDVISVFLQSMGNKQ